MSGLSDGMLHALILGMLLSEPTTMASWSSNQRSSRRVFIVCPIAVKFKAGTAHGIVRDISSEGVFFYSKFRPTLDMDIDFVIQIEGQNMRGTGKVVRVQESVPGAAIGVAVRFSHSKIDRR
jgi:PilZ domain